MKKTILLCCILSSVFSITAYSSEGKIDLAITRAIEHEYIDSKDIEKGWVGVITSIGNMAMVVQKPLKLLFGDSARDFEVMYKVSFYNGKKDVECLALIKAKMKSEDMYKVLIGSCGRTSEMDMFTSGKDRGPQFLKEVHFDDDIVERVRDRYIHNY